MQAYVCVLGASRVQRMVRVCATYGVCVNNVWCACVQRMVRV